jgi:hypothetical protein
MGLPPPLYPLLPARDGGVNSGHFECSHWCAVAEVSLHPRTLGEAEAGLVGSCPRSEKHHQPARLLLRAGGGRFRGAPLAAQCRRLGGPPLLAAGGLPA